MRNFLYTENMAGNLHQAGILINQLGLADYVIAMDYAGGRYTVVVFRMPEDMIRKIRAANPSYCGGNLDLVVTTEDEDDD